MRVNHREYRVQTRGKVYDQLTNPATFGGTAQFYVSRDYYEYLTGETGYGRLLVKAPVWDKTAVTQLADQLEDRLLKMGSESGRLIADPNKHFFQDQIDGLFFLMGVLGALSLILGLLLVYNTITGIIESQTDQIGVMKAIGARTGQVTRFYLSVVLIYGVLALLVSLPLGILGAWSVTLWLIRGFGAEPGAFEVDQTALILQCAIALFAPLLVALAPIFRAARITVREALSTYGTHRRRRSAGTRADQTEIHLAAGDAHRQQRVQTQRARLSAATGARAERAGVHDGRQRARLGGVHHSRRALFDPRHQRHPGF
ncbi:MAG: ABC transporter permease [Anaerolineales bacterium]|nr:ABC transporter permease [Anaerolineales bacterium]